MRRERLATRLEDAYEHEELATSLEVIERRLRRRRSLRRSGVGLSVLGAGIAIAAWAARHESAPTSALTLEDGRPVAALIASADPVARLSDGSSIELASDALIDEIEQSERAIVLRLAAGTARFEVQPNGSREWSVVAGPLTVRVLGTAFTVTRDGAHASVTVHRGVVAVETGAESRRLYAGERFEVGALEPPRMPETLAANEPPPIDPEAEERPASTAETPAPQPAARAARSIAPEPTPPPGAAETAEPSIQPAGDVPAPVEIAELAPSSEGVEELLARADRARREGRVTDAIGALSAIVDEHSSASEAPSAAVALAQLEERRGRLDRAVLAYRRALALDPAPSLAELCYERLVRAHLARGEREQALRARAEHRRRFPSGARARSIEALLRDR